jgi:hypothetical protein
MMVAQIGGMHFPPQAFSCEQWLRLIEGEIFGGIYGDNQYGGRV